MIKDADWEPPYFDPTALADDLEKIAKEMRPMLEPVSGLIDDPELFMKAADEIEDNIGSFPEWMGVEDCCELGAHTTICLLEWTWGTMERKEMATQLFLERILKLDNDATSLHLNKEASLDFFAGLPENVRARVYADLSRANFAPKRDEFTFHMAPDSSSVRAGIRSCGLPSFVRETSGKRLELRRTVDCCRDFPW